MIDPLDGLIEGRTCKITFNTPICLDQCYSCTKTGTEKRHECLGCKNVSYYITNYDNAVNEGYGIPHNCERCNISCYDCYGPFQLKPYTTTNCKRCDYESGYYHYIGEEKTCISYETKEYWEGVIGSPIYLDETPKDDKSKWRWKLCHKNCASCSRGGDDNDNQCDTCKAGLYFYCNQTKGNGIPGSCHDNCVNNGFYLKESEGMQKCCPCFKDCKECVDDKTCVDCYKPFYLAPNNDSCVKDCDYCYAKDNKTFRAWQCVNCKTRYPQVKYNLNGTCYDEIPLITYPDPEFTGKNVKHWVEDDTCNWLTGCKGGCFSCKNWYTEKCTKCKPNYFKEDYYSEPPDPNRVSFPCFTERECHGLDKYKYDEEKEIGGVAKVLDGEGVCYNCRLREGNYRQVENDFTCGPKAKRTYVNITHYNKLSSCYVRCAECDTWGSGCRHNCFSCRDPSLYELKVYDDDPKRGNCERYQHKCKDFPYYHDYDIGEQRGIENCGQECDVCLYDRKCPEQYPFYVIATRECVEACGFPEIMGKVCTMNHTSAIDIFMNNPFELPDKYMSIGTNVKIEQIIELSILQRYADRIGISVESLTKNINTYIGQGIAFNLPNNEIIIGNNISLELTTNKIEMNKIEQLIKEGIRQYTFTSESSVNASIGVNIEKPPILDISECEKIIKKEYNIPNSEDLIILKANNFKEFSQYFSNNVNFLLFSTSLGRILPLDKCMKCTTDITDILNPYNIKDLNYQKKIDAGTNNGYNVLNSNSDFYTDICTPFTSEYGTDVLLDDRREYYPQNIYICKSGCTFVEYNPSLNTYTCRCPTGILNSDGSENTELVTLPAPNFEKQHTNSNIKVFKCASQVFSLKGQKGNFGSYVLLACLAGSIGVIVFYALKGTKQINHIFDDLISIKANPPKNDSGTDSKKRSVNHEEGKVEGKDDEKKSDVELNEASYEEAEEKDHRSFLKIYWSFLKMKQLFIFTFYTSIDRNLRVVKIGLFILFISFYFAFTALFFNDSIMRKIYIYRGNTDAAVHVPNIILSSLCCIIMNFLVNFVSLSNRDMIRAKKENDKTKVNNIKTWIKVKTFILLGISTLLIALFWYYVSAFCAVFKNSQGHYFVNVLVAFIVCNLWPCVTSLIPAALRKAGLSKKSSCMYKASKIVYYI